MSGFVAVQVWVCCCIDVCGFVAVRVRMGLMDRCVWVCYCIDECGFTAVQVKCGFVAVQVSVGVLLYR